MLRSRRSRRSAGALGMKCSWARILMATGSVDRFRISSGLSHPGSAARPCPKRRRSSKAKNLIFLLHSTRTRIMGWHGQGEMRSHVLHRACTRGARPGAFHDLQCRGDGVEVARRLRSVTIYVIATSAGVATHLQIWTIRHRRDRQMTGTARPPI